METGDGKQFSLPEVPPSHSTGSTQSSQKTGSEPNPAGAPGVGISPTHSASLCSTSALEKIERLLRQYKAR